MACKRHALRGAAAAPQPLSDPAIGAPACSYCPAPPGASDRRLARHAPGGVRAHGALPSCLAATFVFVVLWYGVFLGALVLMPA
jgi:hypothetical protein